MKKNCSIIILCFVSLVRLWSTTYYVDSDSGSDSNDGLSESTAWQSIAIVNSSSFSPGDSILFKRGCAWREQLVPCSGSGSGYVTYGAYGSILLPKPLLMGSINMCDTSEWENESGNIWKTADVATTTIGDELLPNPSFDSSFSHWYHYAASPASITKTRDTSVYDSAPACCRVDCSAQGTFSSSIQLYSYPFSLESGKYYTLSFRAKATSEFTIAKISIHQKVSPYTTYITSSISGSALAVTTDWQTYSFVVSSNITADDARLTFSLGNCLPAGASFYLDTLSFKECEGTDVGNIILNEGEVCGNRVWYEADLVSQGDFFYDKDNYLVKMYSESNPASYYDDIEFALKKAIISEVGKSYIIYDNLALCYGGSHGIGGGSTSNIIVRDCDISFIGGGCQYYKDDGTPVRYGNGIEFWGDAHDNLVENCIIYEIYDAALTNQANNDATQYNIYYRNNIIMNSEYSFEYWNVPNTATATTSNIYFENNTCINAGGGWGHFQRPNGVNGRHLMFFRNDAVTDNFYVRNNIFYEASESAMWIYGWADIGELTMSNNLYYSTAGILAKWRDTTSDSYSYYSYENFATYQSTTGKDLNSLVADPCFVDSSVGDWHLAPDSPAIDAGVESTMLADEDINSITRIIGDACDIGAYEYEYDPMTYGLLAYYKMDSIDSGITPDSYGWLDAAVSSATLATGLYNNAMSFNGSNSSVALPVVKSDEISISAWFYKNSNDVLYADAIIGGWRWNSDISNQEGFDLRFYPSSPDTLRFHLVTQNSSGNKLSRTCTYDFGTDNSIGQWHHAVGTYDKTTGAQKLYVDGQLVYTSSHTAGNTIVPLTTYSDIRIGYSRVNNGFFNGLIDEVKFYDCALTATEVSSIYNAE